MNKIRINSLLIALVALVAFAGAALGQVTGGAVTGTVLDANEAAIGGATVVLHDKARGTDFTTQTTSSGTYNFPNVPTGTYTMTVTAAGFAKATGDVTVNLNQTSTANVTVSVAGATAVVNVTGETESVVQTDTSQVGETFKARQFQDLPVGGDPNNLALLAPNVTAPPIGVSGAGAITGGLRQRLNSFTIDGVDNNDTGVSGTVRGVITDSVSEFSFLQNNFNAEFASGGAGAFNTITKSGTNQFHGSVFTYVRSQKLDARTTDEVAGTDKRFFKDVIYGFTVGGPIPYLRFGEVEGKHWKSGKDKLFFFVAAQKDYFKGEGATQGYTAPTSAGLNLIAARPGVSPYVINLVRTAMPLAPSQQFVNCTDPQNPKPGEFGPIMGICNIGMGVINVPQPNSSDVKSWQVNVDHNLNAKNQFRYRYYKYDYVSANGVLVPLFANDTTQSQRSFSANWISNLSASLINDARFGYIKSATIFNHLHDQAQFNFPVIDLPQFGLTLGPADQQADTKKTFQYYDSLTWIAGKHTFKFGGEYIKRPNPIFFLPRHGGEYEYSSLDLFFQDLKPDVQNKVGIGDPLQDLGSHSWAWFAQDDWKISHNLTLNLGVRWDYQSIYTIEARQAVEAPANIPGVIDFHVPKTDKNNFAPRIGFAWSPSFSGGILHRIFGTEGSSSIRANFARSYVTAFSNLVSAGPPAVQSEVSDNGALTNFLQSGGGTGGLPPFVLDTSVAGLRSSVSSLILDHVAPYADAIAVSFQRQLTRSTGIEVRYLRTMGRKLFVQTQLNARPVVDAAMIVPTFFTNPTVSQISSLPTVGTIATANGYSTSTYLHARQLPFSGVLTGDPNIGKSNYNGVSASLTRRLSRNLAATVAYTYSRTYDNSFNELYTSDLNPRRSQDAGEYFQGGLNLGPDYSRSIADIPNRFVASWVYEVPFKSSNSFANAVIGGWEIAGVFQAQSGQLVDLQSGIDSNRNGDGAGDRVLLNPSGPANTGSGVIGLAVVGNSVVGVPLTLNSTFANVRAYVPGKCTGVDPNTGFCTGYTVTNARYVQTGYFAAQLANNGAGTLSRNFLRTRGYNNTDMTFIKNTRFGKEGRYNFQIAAEVYDVFNQREITIGGVGAGGRGFVEPSTTQFLDYSRGVYGGRTITMRAKFIF